MKINQTLIDAAIALMKEKYPNTAGGAAALYTEDGKILTSVGIEKALHDSVNLCHETGSILEAIKLDKKVTASVCVGRLGVDEPVLIYAPCGICQERLRIWGEEVEVAVAKSNDPTRWESKTLKEVQPYYWGNVFK